jgi:hypothetical protein
MAWNMQSSMVYWILYRACVKGVSLTQTHETITSHNPQLTIVYCMEGPTWIGWQWLNIWLRVWLHMSLHYTCIEGPSPHKLNLVSHEHCMLRGCLQHGPWVVPRPCRICDWLLSLSRDHFGSHQGKIIRVTMEFEVPKRHSLRPTLSFDMVRHVLQWERQKRCSGRKTQGPMLEKCW